MLTVNSHNIVKSGYAPDDTMPINEIAKDKYGSKGYECKLRHSVAQHIVFNDSPGDGENPKQQTSIQFIGPESNWETFEGKVYKIIASWEQRAKKIKEMAERQEALKTLYKDLDKQNKELEDKIKQFKKDIENNKKMKEETRNNIQTLKNKLKEERESRI